MSELEINVWSYVYENLDWILWEYVCENLDWMLWDHVCENLDWMLQSIHLWKRGLDVINALCRYDVHDYTINQSCCSACVCKFFSVKKSRAATLKNALIKTSFWYVLHAAASQVNGDTWCQNRLKLSVFCLNDSAFIYLQCWIHCFIIFSKAEHLICSHSIESIYILVIAVCSR